MLKNKESILGSKNQLQFWPWTLRLTSKNPSGDSNSTWIPLAFNTTLQLSSNSRSYTTTSENNMSSTYLERSWWSTNTVEQLIKERRTKSPDTYKPAPQPVQPAPVVQPTQESNAKLEAVLNINKKASVSIIDRVFRRYMTKHVKKWQYNAQPEKKLEFVHNEINRKSKGLLTMFPIWAV